MDILEFDNVSNKEHWLNKIAESDWRAAHFLCNLLKNNKLDDLVGKNAKVLMLTENENLVSFCTLAKMDDVQPTELTPWIGWVYTFPQYRGNRCAGKLLEYAENLAKQNGATHTHISTNHIGLYEKYGYEFFNEAKDVSGEDTRIYKKKI